MKNFESSSNDIGEALSNPFYVRQYKRALFIAWPSQRYFDEAVVMSAYTDSGMGLQVEVYGKRLEKTVY